MQAVIHHHANGLLIVANRLPVRRVSREGKRSWERSSGGLVSALNPLLADRTCTWIGWNGLAESDDCPPDDHDMTYRAVPFSTRERREFYEGFANKLIWPLYHDGLREPQFESRWWETYRSVNQRFADMAAESAAPGATVWVHDYHLQCVPRMLREGRPDLRIGYFLHIPFPPQELFMQLPWRLEVLEGLLGADLIGFQTPGGAENFRNVVKRVLALDTEPDRCMLNGRTVRFGAFPISVDSKHIGSRARSHEVQQRAARLRKRFGQNRKLLLGVDRLDYTKGIDLRMRAFEQLLRRGDVDPATITLIQVAVPTRERVPEYRELRSNVEQIVGEINGAFSDFDHSPIHYLYRSIPFDELLALYVAADVMLVTPLRDGMNLVAKEYIAARPEPSGVLVLSEFAGAAHQLRDAIIVNPHDRQELTQAILRAMAMPADEQARRMQNLQRHVRSYDVFHWARSFWDALREEHSEIEPHTGVGVA